MEVLLLSPIKFSSGTHKVVVNQPAVYFLVKGSIKPLVFLYCLYNKSVSSYYSTLTCLIIHAKQKDLHSDVSKHCIPDLTHIIGTTIKSNKASWENRV